MTRFWITLDQSAHFVLNALHDMRGGEIWVPKIPSMRIMDLAEIIGPDCEKPVIGIRPGEKLHEVMIPQDDARQTVEFERHYIIKPTLPFWGDDEHLGEGGRPCPERFYYGSDNNTQWLSGEQLAGMITGLELAEAQKWAAERGLGPFP